MTNVWLQTKDGWKTWDFTSFSTVFQSYQHDGWLIMKGCLQCNPVIGSGIWKYSENVQEIVFIPQCIAHKY